MNAKIINKTIIFLMFLTLGSCTKAPVNKHPQTVALWLFDEPQGIYPSSVLDDSSPNDIPLTIGQCGKIVHGKFGDALKIITLPKLNYPSGEARFGLAALPIRKGRTVEPMNWKNAGFAALMTSGEKHLRKEVGYANVTDTKLNLGNFDWTVEFWLLPDKQSNSNGVVFEIGSGPRGENNKVTRLSISKMRDSFIFSNYPSNTTLKIKSNTNALNPDAKHWHHFAFVYNSSKKELLHYVDGKLISKNEKVKIKSLPRGNEAYMSIGTNGLWKDHLPGIIDELRFSEGMVYTKEFVLPKSFAPQRPNYNLVKGPPLLFDTKHKNNLPIYLGSRKHLFIDDAFIQKMENVKFVVNPPRKAERVLDHISKQFRKHLTVVQDKDNLIRIYNSGPKDYLQVFVSKDGIHFKTPDVGHGTILGQKNIVIPENVGGLGNPFIDSNGPDSTRWKYISGYHRRGIYVFTSPDGYNWKRNIPALLPFRSGTQSCSFYDDQRQEYVGYHRSGIFATPGGVTQRSSVVTETKNLYSPIEFKPLTWNDYLDSAKVRRLRKPLPWYLDNGPLTPGGFGLEFPHKFDPIKQDQVGTDIYVTKAQKYKWAPDTYLAFPIVYYHYEKDGPLTRQILGSPMWKRGSGPIETQIEVSRDGLNWKRYPRAAYVGMGKYLGREIHQIYIADGMIRRGNEIWQYFFGSTEYHSSYTNNKKGQAVYRLVQRLDGFISMDSPYNKEAYVITKPFIFKGKRLSLNVYTDATGYVQVGFLDENGKPIKNFSVDDCVYVNGDFINTNVQWLKDKKQIKELVFGKKKEITADMKNIKWSDDVSELQGKIVKLVFKMRGAKLYSIKFN